MCKLRRYLVFVLATVFLFGQTAFAQTETNAASLLKIIRELQQIVSQLQSRVEQISPSAKPFIYLGPPVKEKAGTSLTSPEQLQTSAPQTESSAAKEPEPTPSVPPRSREWCHNFGVGLGLGNRGEVVSFLQKVLEDEGFSIAAEEKDSRYFGESTAAAVSGFQEKYRSEILDPLGLKYPTGFVGKSTRAKLNSLYGCSVIPPGIPPKVVPPVIPPGIPPKVVPPVIPPGIPPKVVPPLHSRKDCPRSDKICPDGSCEVFCPPLPLEEELVSESVKCVFKGSPIERIWDCKGYLYDPLKERYNTKVPFASCSGVESCGALVKGKAGTKIYWESSWCKGHAYTTLDGKDEYAEFDCSKLPNPR